MAGFCLTLFPSFLGFAFIENHLFLTPGAYLSRLFRDPTHRNPLLLYFLSNFIPCPPPKIIRMDKTVFKNKTVEEADDAMGLQQPYGKAAAGDCFITTTSIAYKFDMDNPPRMDKKQLV